MYSSGLQAQYSYDPYGRVDPIIDTVPADFGFAHYYMHARSVLNLTRTRMFSSKFGRWLNRDLIAEAGGVNLCLCVESSILSTEQLQTETAVR